MQQVSKSRGGKRVLTSNSQSVQRTRRTRRVAAAAMLATSGLFSVGEFAKAATRTWSAAPVDASWSTTANWVGNTAVPGITTGSLSADIALFNSAIPGSTIGSSGNPIQVQTGRVIGGITFDTANVGAYTIGTAGSSTLILTSNQAGASIIQMNSAVTSSEVIASVLHFDQGSSTNGTYTIQNNAASSTATLLISGNMENASTRPILLTLGGSNTGNNTITGIVNETNGVQQVPLLTKTGVGTWILTGTNIFAGQAETVANAANGIQVNQGVLVMENNQALGTNGTANTNLNNYINGGVLELNASGPNGVITLDNGLIVTLNGGTLRSNGSNFTNGRVSVGTNGGTIATVNSTDTFTIGNGANDFSGGTAGTSIVHMAGPGTILLGNASNQAGIVSAESGTIVVNSNTGFGASTAGLAFGSNSTANVMLQGVTATLATLDTNQNTVGTPVINSSSGNATLSIGNATVTQTSTFAGLIQDGTGTLNFTKTNLNTQIIGSSNTFSGASNVTGGTLKVSNTSGSALGTSTLTISTGTLTGSGTVSGSTTTGAATTLIPGVNGTGILGIATGGSSTLTLAAGGTINFGVTTTGLGANYISTSNLILPGSGSINLNLYQPGTTTPFSSAISGFDLFQVPGTITNTAFLSELHVATALAGLVPSFNMNGNFLTLTLMAAGTNGTWTNGAATSNWNNTGNWSGGAVPSSAGDTANFAAVAGAINLDTNETIGNLTFGSGSYLISSNNSSVLTFDNSSAGAAVINGGTATLATNITLGDNFTASGGGALKITGNISETGGAKSFTSSSTGTVSLAGTNSYTGGTSATAGVLNFAHSATNDGNLGATATPVSVNGATLQFATGNSDDITSTRLVTIGINGATIDTNGNTVTFAGALGNSGTGTLTKVGAGVLNLYGTNTYIGQTNVTAGVLGINSNASLGAPSGGGTLAINNATLTIAANAVLNNGATGTNDRPVTLLGDGTFVPATGATLTVTGLISGPGKLNAVGPGTIAISNAVNVNTYSGQTLISGGTVSLLDAAANATGLGTGTVTIDGGFLKLFLGTTATGNGGTFNLPVRVDGGSTGSLSSMSNGAFNSSVFGAGTFDYQTDFTRAAVGGNWSAFTGQINVTKGPNGGDFRLNTTTGFGTAAVNLGPGVSMYEVLNFSGNPTTDNVGELTGDSTSFVGGQNAAQSGRTLIWSVGGRNTNAQFDGVIGQLVVSSVSQPVAVTKVGTGNWTLTNTSTYTGTTTITGGTLTLGTNTVTGVGGALTNTSNYQDNANLTFNRNDGLSIPVGIFGSGSISQNGTGMTSLTFATGNGFSGGAAVNAGTLGILSEWSLGGAVYGGITFNGGAVQYANPVAPSQNYDLTMNSAGTPAPVPFVLLANGGTIDTNSNSITFASSITGVGGIAKTGAGTLTFAGANTYSGTTTIATDTLQVGGGTTSGQLGTGLVVNNASLQFNRSDTLTVPNSITGMGAITQIGTGTTILSGTSDYTGPTTVTNGTLLVNGQLTGSSSITVDATNVADLLVLNGANAIPSTATVTGIGSTTVPTIAMFAGQSFAALNTTGSTNVNFGISTIGTVDGTGSLGVGATATLNTTDHLNQPNVTNFGSVAIGGGTSAIGTLSGGGALTVASGATVNVSAALNQGAVQSNGTLNVTGGTSNTVTAVDGTGTLAVTGGANLTATHIRQGALAVGPSSLVTVSFDNQAHTGGTPTHTSVVTTLSVDPTGTLDLTNNGIVILDTTQLGAVGSLIAQAADETGGHPHWDLPGITSSNATADPFNPSAGNGGHAVGFGLASAIALSDTHPPQPTTPYTSFNGVTFSDAIIARYTLEGDHDLKGHVDLSDYTIVIKNIGQSGKTWTDGNFDYSGTVNLSDYTKVILNIGRGDGQGVFTATGPSAQQVKASSLTLHTTPAVTQASTATDVTLLVNPTNGRVTLINALQTGQAVITAYTINSSSGSLVTFSQDSNGKYLATAIENNPGVFYQSSNGGTFNRWTGIKNVTTFIGEGFSQNYNANNDSTWTNYTMAAGGYALGGLFKRLSSGGVRDLVFQWNDANQSTFTSVVNYVGASVSTPEPGSVSLIAMGAMGLLGRRRRRSAK